MQDKMHARKSYTALLLLSVGVLSLGCTPTDSNQVTLETDSRQASTHAAVGAEKSAVTVSHSAEALVSVNTAAESEQLAESVSAQSQAPDQTIDTKDMSVPEQSDASDSKDTSAAAQADSVDIAQHNQNQNSLPEIITGMEAGMPYAEARALIDQTIWAPKTHPPLDTVSTSVQNMRDLGYEEVRDCAGTGLGLCRMEFIEREGLVLVIIVTTSEAEPMVWTWDVE
ncbi:hypothetical protein IQ260_13450 [Leptolyngbya cf. ectocarpi LEGE 11479]|uniref:CAP domain-containing protein n=1 Tax=Leptolyngbya cf. ectocarpi LEGE 11479 TaxID=1828722 RepID=A0A928ZUF3_LEPEC|nr:hypothetical protein [Leptolyngbya ectocarpi]MBE9067661.1 hypothetical protein [Leptolyngbya cf. ectocarpi LEGE 11479]